MRKVLLVIAFLSTYTVHAQAPRNLPTNPSSANRSSSFSDKVKFGGNVGGNFGTTNYIQLTPFAAYSITEDFLAGLGVTYYYLWSSDPTNKYSENYYGFNVFTRYYLLKDLIDNGTLFVHAEWEPLNIARIKYDGSKERAWMSSVLLGGGVAYGNFTASALYIVNYNKDNSPYTSPLVVRFGVLF